MTAGFATKQGPCWLSWQLLCKPCNVIGKSCKDCRCALCPCPASAHLPESSFLSQTTPAQLSRLHTPALPRPQTHSPPLHMHGPTPQSHLVDLILLTTAHSHDSHPRNTNHKHNPKQKAVGVYASLISQLGPQTHSCDPTRDHTQRLPVSHNAAAAAAAGLPQYCTATGVLQQTAWGLT
jgi:hypothetical protein